MLRYARQRAHEHPNDPTPMNKRFSLAFLLSLSFTIAGLHAADISAPSEFRVVRSFIQQGIQENRSPSVAVAVIRDDKIVWAEGFGMADIEAKRPATADSGYLLASVSKPMTATGLMVLVDRGLVDLDRPANDYLGKVKLRAHRGSAKEMTVRRLANHTSGMPVHWSFFYNGVAPPSRDTSIERYGYSYNAPGSHWEYCNLAFGVLDHIVATVGRPSYRDFMEKHVYDPLGMTHTSDRVRPGIEKHASAQYAFDAGGRFVRVAPYGFDHDGASANWSSANDLARFLRMHLNNGSLDGTRVLTEKSAKFMRALSAVRDPKQSDSGTGVAWFVGPYMGFPSFAHSGGMPGVSTRVRGFPEHMSGYVVLLNAPASRFRAEIETRLTQALLPDAKASPPSTSTAAPETEPDWSPYLGVWKGRLAHYGGNIDARLEITDENRGKISLNGKPALTLRNLELRSGKLFGNVTLRLATQPSFHGLVDLQIRLTSDDDGLSGIGVAQARDYFSLSHFMEFARSRDPADAPTSEAVSSQFDILIRNGKIVDGSGAPWFRGDIGIREGRIVKIGRLNKATGKQTIDASGLVVSPGFIDMMGQTATPFLEDPTAGNNLLSQGVTTILAGEGGSAAPLNDADAKKMGWKTMREYFELLDRKGMPINVVQNIGHTQVRRLVIGRTDREPTEAELKQMQALVREAMEAGAIGVSTALIYPPAIYASTDEIAALARVAGEHGGRYYTHMHNEGDRLLEAIDEALEIGDKANAAVHIFHLKAAGQANWGKMQLAIARIKAARAAGQDVDADINNGLSLSAFIHPRHSAKGPQEFLRRIQNPKFQKEMREELETGEGWENWFRHAGHDWNKVVLGKINSSAYRKYNGQTLGAIARAANKDEWRVFWEILPNGAFALPQSMTEANKIAAMREEFVSFCTDVGPAGGSRIASHPRGYGSFPRILSKYVRDHGVISLEKAIAKMSSVAANQILVHDRGKLAEGLAADVVIFDYEGINDRATFAEPNAHSEGVKYVFVNGQLVFADGKHTGARPGKVLRGPGYRR
jgi:N-acyl-D-aspartate/D-glutamate deacylase/CubicO group peptidase (beta-lactamase class C family)